MSPITADAAVLTARELRRACDVRHALAALLLAVLATAAPAHAWERDVPLGGEVSDVGVPAIRAERLFVPLTLGDPSSREDFVVLAVSTRDGETLWRRTIDGQNGHTGGAFVAVADRAGDVVVGGYTDDHEGGPFHRLRVVKLDGATGDVLWKPELGIGIAWHVALDRHGDVIVLARDTAENVGRVVKLEGTSGALEWEATSSPMLVGIDPTLVVDRRGDVTVGGEDGVRRFDARDGSLQWWSEGSAIHALLPSTGGGVTAYQTWPTGTLVRLDRRGRERWRRPLEARPDLLRTNRRGDVVAISPPTSGGYGSYPFTVTRIDRASGATVWTHEGIGGFAAPIADVSTSDASQILVFGWADRRGCVRSIDARSGRAVWDRRATLEGNPARVVDDGARVFTVSDAGIGLTIADVSTLPDASTKGIGLCGMD